MENSEHRFLAEAPTGKLMRRYAMPCVISLLVGALYNIVDQIFIANASYLGSFGNAANTVVFPMTVIALAIAVMIGDGCCAFVSLSLGKGRPEDASRSTGNAVVLSVTAGFVLMAIYLLLRDPLLTVFGGRVNDETFRLAQEYFFWITLGIPLYMFGQAMNPVIRADGSPRFAMLSTLAGAVVNIILDPVFLFVCKWGMMGAAVATVLGQALTAALAVWYLFHSRIVRLHPADFCLKAKTVWRTLSLGACSFLSQISLVAAMAAINNMVRKYGALDPIFSQTQYAQIPMAVVGIVMKFFQIIISIVVGMAAGCIPIVGYNMGAERKDRVRTLFRRLLLCEALVGAVGLIRAPSSAFSVRQTRACTIRTSLCAPSAFICACLCLPVSTRPASSSCRPWERRRPPRRCLWCVRSSSASASRCSCRCSGDWTAYCGPCRSRIS